MSALNSLKLTSARKPQSLSAIHHRRNKLSNKLWEQIELAKSHISGKPFVVTRFRSVKDEDTGMRRQVEMPKRLRPWWFVAENGKVCLQVRYGTRVLELAKGKNSIEVGSGTELLAVLETVKKCVEDGELDTQIEAASAAVRERFAH